MTKNPTDITNADITFIGSGIAMVYTLIKFLETLYKTGSTKILEINIIEKYPEFFFGIPYGKRSGKSVLLINSLRAFLPKEERSIFIEWLKVNKDRLLEGYLIAGGEESKRWLDNNIADIDDDLWDDLFIPRSFFGEYIHAKVNESIKQAEKKGLIKTTYIVSEAIDILKHPGITEIKLDTGKSLFSKEIVLCVGSLPPKKIYSENLHFEDNDFLLINDIYNEDLGSNFDKIENFLLNRKNNETNVLIVGANASSLETIYKLNNKKEVNGAITNYIVLSTHGKMPDSEIDLPLKEKFIPENLMSLQNKVNITAKEIADAAFKDIDLSDKINLGAASTVDVISKAFGVLLNKLSIEELEIFACKYGNEIGRKQRCAGVHYTSVVDKLKESNKFIHIAGKYSDIIKGSDSNYKFEFIDSKTTHKHIFPKNIHLVVNCIGSIDLENENTPILLKNLLDKKYIIANKSKIGLKVNDTFKASENIYVSGPLLAGNVIEGKPLWHLEHCGRIIWSSNLVGECLTKNKV
jgi:uncharacterized NAD(P)/FAD-binding protein YdhS